MDLGGHFRKALNKGICYDIIIFRFQNFCDDIAKYGNLWKIEPYSSNIIKLKSFAVSNLKKETKNKETIGACIYNSLVVIKIY